MERSLNMQLPRGWYQVAGVEPATFRRHGLSTASGNLQICFHPPHDGPVASGEEALDLLKIVLSEHHLPTGTPIGTGHQACAAGYMAFAAYKQIHGQCEYWLIPHDEANVFAKWQAGSTATCGMERHDIHEMLRALHFEGQDAGEAPTALEEPEVEGVSVDEFGQLVIDPDALVEADPEARAEYGK